MEEKIIIVKETFTNEIELNQIIIQLLDQHRKELLNADNGNI